MLRSSAMTTSRPPYLQPDLEHVWESALPGRQAAERNAFLRRLRQLLSHDELRQRPPVTLPVMHRPRRHSVTGSRSSDVAPNFYPAAIGVWRVLPCWAVMVAGRGAEPSGKRSAADRRAAA
jgi:hypothetical protein